jgi:hypothetical protein
VLQARLAALKPTLSFQAASSRTARVPDDGNRHNMTARCPDGDTAVAGGYFVRGAGPQMIPSFSERFSWLIGAAGSGGMPTVETMAVCARGLAA